MSSILGVLGFPPPQRRDSVRFYFAKALPYGRRIALTLLLLFIGLGLQLVLLRALPGIPFLLVAVALVLVKGYDSRVRLKTFTLDPSWKEVPIEKIREIERLRKRTVDWDQDAFDISNPLGVICLFLWLGAAVVISYILGKLAGAFEVTTILIADAVILSLPLWFTGMRFILKQPNLNIRVKLILKMFDAFQKANAEGELFKPALMFTRGPDGKAVPTDARFSVAFSPPREGFYGLQAQINLNVVQGRSYPYFYCVLAAKPDFGIKGYRENIRTDRNIICEYQKDAQAEALVIRQATTRTSGYYTKDDRCARILQVALEGGRAIGRGTGSAAAAGLGRPAPDS
jgi:hypothetical protein